MSKPSFLNHYKLLENNLALLSPYQVNCLAWKYWQVSRATIPLVLLAVLPQEPHGDFDPHCSEENSEYFASSPPLPCEPLLISLGKANLNYLVLDASKKKMVISKVLQCLNGSVADVYELDMLGNLICHLSPSIIQNGISKDVIAATINQLKACTNLSHEQNIGIKYRLLQLCGNPLNWSSETIQDMAPFLSLLSREEFMGILIKFPNTVFQMLSETEGIPLSEEMLSALFDAVRTLSANVSIPDQRAECEGVTAPSSEDIMKLSEANSYWSLKELRCIDADTVTRNVHILGAIRSFNRSQLSVIKERVKQVWGTLSDWKSYHITSLGRIATALSDQEIDALDLSSIDAVSALSQQVEWTFAQAQSILRGFLNDSAKSVSDLKGYDLAGLAPNLCAANPELIYQIQTSEFSAALPRISSLACDVNILRAFKRKAEMVFGKAETWSRFVLHDVGYIAAGLSKEDLKALHPDLMPYIHAAAIKNIPGDTFKELSPEQIANLGPENAAMVTESQRAQLTAPQLQSLDQALHGVRRNIHDPEPLSTATSPPVSDSGVRAAGYCICAWVSLYFLTNYVVLSMNLQ
ncbi:hypothetical protein FKM82_021192 [Ascaphus truei]